jgi:hypothetical protein
VPKIFGTNILIILLAAFLFFLLGWLWYGGIFGAKWTALTGMTKEIAEATMGRAMAVGFLLSLLQATGLAGIMSMKQDGGLAKGLKVGALSWSFFALPLTAYAWNYENAPADLFRIDAGYLLVGYLLMGAVYGLLRKTD